MNSLFIGTTPTGIAYADRTRQENGDYKKIAHLSFATLTITFYDPEADTDTLNEIIHNATEIQMQAGQPYQVSTAGQTVILGYALTEAEQKQINALSKTVHALSA